MPLYEYQCPRCGRFELIQKFSDSPLTVCPTCGSEVQKLPSAPAIQFKGTGWYVTDYARKSSSGEAAKKDGAGPGAKEGGSASKDSSSKESSSSKEGSTKEGSTGGTTPK